MSADLNVTKNGQVAFVANTSIHKPWHGLGQSVQSAMTWKKAIKLAHLNWTVSKQNLIHPLTGAILPDTFGMFRDDNKEHLGTVGNVYQAIQNEQAFDFVDTLLEAENGSHYETAGALGKGEKIFCLASVPYSFAPDRAKDDLSETYLLFTNSHDGKSSAIAKLTSVRVVCQNTLNLALGSKDFGSLKIKHSSQGTIKLEEAKKLLTGVKQSVKSLKEKMDILAKRKMDKKSFSDVMAKLWGKDWNESSHKKNIAVDVASLFESNDNNAFPSVRGTAYNMLQAVTNYIDHNVTVRSKGKDEKLVRAESAIFGTNAEFKSDAVDYILENTIMCKEMTDATVVYSMPSFTNDIMSKMNY